MKKRRGQKFRFAICITGSEPDLELRKIYQVLPDEKADKVKYLRVIDESGEDYLYPQQYFIPTASKGQNEATPGIRRHICIRREP